jgi:hypothetical protein
LGQVRKRGYEKHGKTQLVGTGISLLDCIRSYYLLRYESDWVIKMDPLIWLFITFFATFLWIVFLLHKRRKFKKQIGIPDSMFIGLKYNPKLERKK